MIYNSRTSLLKALANTEKGEKRSQILNIEQNRDLIKSSGANVTLYSGEPTVANSVMKELDNIYIGVINRLNAKTGKPDGIGALGGLSERTNEQEFATLTPTQKRALVGKKDDIIIINNEPVLTHDITIIAKNNVVRETNEELGNLGIYDFRFNSNDMCLVDMSKVKDDNFAINIWNGKGDVWCISPYCHTLKTSEETLDMLSKRSQDIHTHEQNSEAAVYNKIKLTKALISYGNTTGKDKLEDGRNAKTDYRYPHEWLVSWALASKLLNHDEEKMLKLYQELQSQTPWKISFNKASEKMGIDLKFVSDILKISLQTVEKMEKFPNGIVFINSSNRHL